MATMSHMMETSDSFGRPVSLHATGLSTTSGEGEGEAEKGVYNFTARRKNRRKTITLNDIQRLTTGTQSLSESAFGTPSPSPFNATLPPSQLRLQTSFNPLDYNGVNPSPTPQSSPRRTSGRNTINSSPVKKQAGVLPGTAIANSDTIAADVLKELERGRGRGIPRTLTLPAHLTESLMKMKITRERDGSADVMVVPPDVEATGSMNKVDKDGMDVDGTEVDAAEPQKLKPALFIQTQSPESIIQREQGTPPRSPRKGKRRRARSAPPRQRANPHADACDGDDEDGGTTEGDDNDTGPLSPAPAPRRRGRQDGASASAMGIGDEPMEMMMPGMMPVASGVLRRSARRVKPAGTGIGPVFGGANQFLKGIVEAEAGSGMDLADVVIKGTASRKRARTREVEPGSGMEVAEGVGKGNSPRKRARTREGGDRDKERGRDEEGRATKRTRKR